jgi:phosphoribosylaminoimidazole-succinocarboxamide synthase
MARKPVAEGKTKRLVPVNVVEMFSKNDMTAFDGKKHDVPKGKGALATRTTVNIFEFLRRCGIPVAYIGPGTDTSFYALNCAMISIEVVVRGKAYGSILEREPDLVKGQEFEEPLVEFYLKTVGGYFGDFEVGVDDPLMEFDDQASASLFHPRKQRDDKKSFIWTLSYEMIFTHPSLRRRNMVKHLKEAAKIAARTYRILRAAFATFGYDYVDFKVEFGITKDGRLVLADVIDSDSGRLLYNGVHQDKQSYREGEAVDVVMAKYANVARITDQFMSKYPRLEALANEQGTTFEPRFIQKAA